ncbi:ATP-binding protein [Lysobacter sp. M15]|uniref:AlbA family DNA-binding domain-containing protein n=1 Tax=Lysobacter sp. M15 TaxID=2916837 RepID=UPI001F5A4F99|nr:ATP-binding protein [Lysobacter sp. M15]
MSEIVDRALLAKRESKHIEFKRSFDPSVAGAWCELVKDIVALSNSGGGAILIGVENNGIPSGEDVSQVLELDQAVVADKVFKYTSHHLHGIEIHEAEKDGETVAAIEISAVDLPVVFESVGTYEVDKKQKTAFARGTVYFRHGAKSEPGTTADLRAALERRLKAIRAEWLRGVKKVVTSPAGSVVSALTGDVLESKSANASPIRFVDDPNAPGYRLIDHDVTYPYRQTELLRVVNAMLPDLVTINSRDLLAVRRTLSIDGNALYCHTPKFGTTQYSDSFAEWLVEQHKANSNFFENSRSEFNKKLRVKK